MTNLRLIIPAVTLTLFILLLPSCKKNDVVNPVVKIKTVSIKNEGAFNYTGGLVYAVVDSLAYEINITTEPTNATVFYSFNNGEIHQKNSDFILIDSTAQFISFFSTKEGVCMTGNNRLDFGFQNDSLPSNISVSPNPTDSIITYTFDGNIRGFLNVSLFDVTGKELFNSIVFLDNNTNQNQLDLSPFVSGVYLLKFHYGNSTMLKKIVKTN